MAHNEQIYRIGLFGRSNAGKTSLLVALSEMKEHVLVDDNSWTISYLPPVQGKFTDKGLFEKLTRGERLLNEAKDSINKTHKPPITSEKEKTTLYRFQLASGGSTRTVELWDYAGEILDPSRLDNVESHGYELGKRIADCDAVLVLAPASDSSDESKVDAERSEQIAQSLAQLHSWIKDNDKLSEVRRRPFALIVTKTDRVAPPQIAMIEELGIPAAHVWETIQSLIGSGVTRRFGLSTKQEAGSSSDLLSPLVWAMNAADKEVIELAKRAGQLGVTGWGSKSQASKQIRKLISRRPPTADVIDPINQQANGVKKSLSGSLRFYRSVTMGVAVILIWLSLGGVEAFLTSRYAKIANDASASVEDLKESEQHFDAYGSSLRRLSLFALDSKSATELRDQARELRAERQWQLVGAEVDPIKKGALAKNYTIDFPEKISSEEVIEVVRREGEEAARRHYSNWFVNLKIRSARTDLTIDQRSELIDAMASMPSDLIESKEESDQRNGIVDQLRSDQTSALTNANRQKFVETLENFVQRKNPFEALSAIKDKPESLDWPEMGPTLILIRDNWKGDIDSRLSVLRKDEQFEKAVQIIQLAIRDLKVIPASAELPDEPDLTRLLSDLQGEWDKSEYDDFKANPSIQLGKAYLSSAHPKCMSQTIENWMKWKQSEFSSRSLRPQLVSITWDKDNGVWHPMIDFYVNDQKIMDKQLAGNGKAGETNDFAETGQSLEFDMKKPVQCRIVVWDDNMPWYDWLTGEFTGTYSISELIQPEGKTDFLRFGKATHTFRIRLVGMVKAPELLEWQPCQ